jgi:hypothetical protein
MVVAYMLSGLSNYFLRRPFVADAVFSVVGMVTLAFLVINFIDKAGAWQPFAKGVDWRMVPATVLILFALWVLAGLAVACSTRLEMIPTLAVCSGFFLIGLMSDYLFGKPAQAGAWWASVLYTVIPNWQVFWLVDTLEPGKSGVPLSYLGIAFGYVAGYLGATMAVALVLFEDRELS